MVVDHPVVVIPEDVLGRAGGRVQDAGQGDGGALVHVVLLSPLDVGLREHHIELHPSGDGPSAGGHLALVDAAVPVLHELDLEKHDLVQALDDTAVIYLENPVEGSLLVEHIEPVVCGEPDQAVGEDVPVPDPDPGDEGVAHGPVPGVGHRAVQEGRALPLHGHVGREPRRELRHQVTRTENKTLVRIVIL